MVMVFTSRTDIHRHTRRPDVGRVGEYLRGRQPAPLTMEVVDGEPADADRLSRVITLPHGRDACFQRHGRVKDLEGRPHLIDAEGISVEHLFIRRARQVMRVKVRK
jgi:hypothetical protein